MLLLRDSDGCGVVYYRCYNEAGLGWVNLYCDGNFNWMNCSWYELSCVKQYLGVIAMIMNGIGTGAKLNELRCFDGSGEVGLY